MKQIKFFLGRWESDFKIMGKQQQQHKRVTRILLWLCLQKFHTFAFVFIADINHLREKCTNKKLFLVRTFLYSDWIRIFHCVKSVQIRSYFWSVFSFIRTEYGDLLRKSLLRKSPYSIRIQENADQN